MPWAIAAAGVAAAGAIGGSLISANASSGAADTIANSANNANNIAASQFNQTQANLAPFMQGGTNALSALLQGIGLTGSPATIGGIGQVSPSFSGFGGASSGFGGPSPTSSSAAAPTQFNLSGFVPPGVVPGGSPASPGSGGGASGFASGIGGQLTGQFPAAGQGGQAGGLQNSPLLRQPTLADFTTSPGFNFQMQQGLDAISNSAAARGGSFSGNTLKEIQGFGTGLANQDWWNFVNNFSGNQNRTLQTLFGLSGAGQNAAAGLGGLGANTAATIGNNLTGAGSALAAGQIGVANAANSGLNNLSNILQQLKFQGGDGSFNNNPGNLVASSSQSTGPF